MNDESDIGIYCIAKSRIGRQTPRYLKVPPVLKEKHRTPIEGHSPSDISHAEAQQHAQSHSQVVHSQSVPSVEVVNGPKVAASECSVGASLAVASF